MASCLTSSSLRLARHRPAPALLGKKTSHVLLKLVSFSTGIDRLGGNTVLLVLASERQNESSHTGKYKYNLEVA
jgi:hypothetical protein